MHEPPNRCETTLIAQSTFCSVTLCADCHTFHVQVGPMTLHLKQRVFDDLCEMLLGIHAKQNSPRLPLDSGVREH